MNNLDCVSENNSQEDVIWLNFTVCAEKAMEFKLKKNKLNICSIYLIYILYIYISVKAAI